MVKVDDGKTQQRGAVLTEFYRQEKRLPSFSEMARLFGVSSKGSVAKIVDRLEAAGYLQRDGQGHLLPGSIALPIRRRGFVEAGLFSPAEEDLGEPTSLDEMLIQNKTSSFLLTVSGDSMVDAGLVPGDLIVVDRSLPAKNGDIVVAMVDGKTTLKYFSQKGNRITLTPANQTYQPVTVPAEECQVLGVVRSLARVYR
jgi:SOS regulatory protein LexA